MAKEVKGKEKETPAVEEKPQKDYIEEMLASIAHLDPAQKAATVIVSLGVENASEIYKFIEPEEVEKLTLQVAKLSYSDPKTTEGVLTEFYRMCLANQAVTEGGIGYARDVLEKAFGREVADELLNSVNKNLVTREFDFLSKADDRSLFSALQHERAQTIALVLSYVDPEKGAIVIEQLDIDKQAKVMENIASMESASPMAVKIIEEEMSKRFSSIVTTKNIDIGGIDYVASIMNNLDRSSEKRIFDHLFSYNEELAEEIRKRMFTFEDIVTMDDRSVQRFVRDCDVRDLVLALKAANADVANKLFTNMSSRMATSIKDDLEITTNVRIKDAEEAQQRIVSIIRTLEEQNELVIMKGGKDEIIA